MSKLISLFKLTRIEHSIMLCVAVLAAELMSGGLPALPILILSLITPIFISMGAFAINDYFDVEVDRLNEKKRPLVVGELSPKSALYITAVSMIVGLAASVFINPFAFVIAVIFCVLSLLYGYKLKELLLWGNAYIAFSMAIPFIFGNYVVSGVLHASIIFVSAMIFLSGLSREIHGTIRDLKGDMAARNVHTLPKVIGKAASARIALVFYVIAILISIYLFADVLPFKGNFIYLIPILAVDLSLLYVGIGYLKRDTGKFHKLARNLSLASMAIALLTLLISSAI